MNESATKEISNEAALAENKYKDIKPENGATYSDSKQFWKDVFSERSYVDDNGNQYRVGDSLEPNTSIEKNGYTYRTDELGRVSSAEGKLQVKDHHSRNDMPDSRDVVARGEMAEGDDRGHLIADMFNGSGELENLVPMNAELNRGDYLKLEMTLREAVNDGATVEAKVEPIYSGDSYKPDEIRYTYTIDGDKETVIFKNGSGE